MLLYLSLNMSFSGLAALCGLERCCLLSPLPEVPDRKSRTWASITLQSSVSRSFAWLGYPRSLQRTSIFDFSSSSSSFAILDWWSTYSLSYVTSQSLSAKAPYTALRMLLSLYRQSPPRWKSSLKSLSVSWPTSPLKSSLWLPDPTRIGKRYGRVRVAAVLR